MTSSVPGATTSPRLAGRALTMPANGAFTLVSSICCQTDICRARAAASCASAMATALRVCSRSRAASAPPLTSDSVRRCSVRATASAVSAEVTLAFDDSNEDSRSRDAIFATRVPASTVWPRSSGSATRLPPTCARTVACLRRGELSGHRRPGGHLTDLRGRDVLRSELHDRRRHGILGRGASSVAAAGCDHRDAGKNRGQRE